MAAALPLWRRVENHFTACGVPPLSRPIRSAWELAINVPAAGCLETRCLPVAPKRAQLV